MFPTLSGNHGARSLPCGRITLSRPSRRLPKPCHGLPHMDEEVEHLQWQLDKRSQDAKTSGGGRHSSSASNGGGRGRKPSQHVFHSRQQQRAGSVRRLHKQQQHAADAGAGASSFSAASLHSVSLESMSEPVPAAAAVAAADNSSAASASTAGLYHLRLRHSNASSSTGLRKARDRLFKHLMQDGGCFVSVSEAAAQSSVLTHLLVLLQQKQSHAQPGNVLLLQPVDCDAAATSHLQLAAALAHDSSGGSGASTVVQHVSSEQQSHVCETAEPIKLWAAALPLGMLLGLQLLDATAAAAGEPPAAAAVMPGSGQPQGGTAASVWGISSAESSAEENRSSSSSSSSSSRATEQEQEQLLQAAGHCSASVGAVLLQAQAQQGGGLRIVRVGPHADAAAVASAVLQALQSGRRLVALHVKGHAAAHCTAFLALQLAASGGGGDSNPGSPFGFVVVPGAGHEHVHAVQHSHSAADGSDAPHGSRVAVDSSMDVSGFSAVFHGTSSRTADTAAAASLHHKHAQEVWLCVLPLSDLK